MDRSEEKDETDVYGIRCPKCGAFFEGKLDEKALSVNCTFCGTTIVLRRRRDQPSKPYQYVVKLEKWEAKQREEYGKLVEDMTIEEKVRLMQDLEDESDKERLQELEDKQEMEGLTEKEQRELAFIREKPAAGAREYGDDRHYGEYCLSCYRKIVYRCVNCENGTCGSADCESTFHYNSKFAVYGLEGRTFTLYCPNCGGYICKQCYSVKRGLLGDKYHCKKCNTQLEKKLQKGRRIKFD